jgi:hypothetical protein
MADQINYKFVKPQIIQIADNGEVKPLTVLVLDDKANNEYWKFMNSFPEFLQSLNLTDVSQIKQWLISTGFIKLPHYIDLIETDEQQDLIFGIPVKYIEDENIFCVIQLADDTLKENDLWQ